MPRLTALLFIAVAVIYALSPQGRRSYSDLAKGAEVSRVAMSLAEEGSFAHPFYPLPTGPTAHDAPGYVLIYAGIARVFGTGLTGAEALWALNIAFLALQLALLPALSERLGLGAAPGILAAVFGVIVQPYRVLVEWDSLFTGALLVVLCLLTWSYFRAPGDWRRSLLLGMLWGAAVLTNPESVLLLFVWAHVAAAGGARHRLGETRRAMLVVVAGVALACLPWFLRNYEVFHSVFFVRDNLGLELYTSNNPCARPTMLENLTSGCHALTHPNANAELAAQVVEKGESGFNREMLRRALSWIAANPGAFAALTAKRALRFWFPFLGGYRYAVPMAGLTILSFAGLFWMREQKRAATYLFAATMAVYPLVHYLIQFEARYRYPVFWVTLLPAAYAIMKLTHWPKQARSIRQIEADEEREMSLV